MGQTHVNKTEALHKFSQLHPEAAVIQSAAFDILALLAAADHTCPLRTGVRPFAIPLSLAVGIANAQQLHAITGRLSHFTSIDDAVGVVG
jgi:hypothetical protein